VNPSIRAVDRALVGIAGSDHAVGHGCLSVVSVACCQVEVSSSEPILRPEASYRVCAIKCDQVQK